jgi:glycerophosphoryl diester phosphodiesterase
VIALAGFLTFAETLTKSRSEVSSLHFAHAHNDYEHPNPLMDALENGFHSVEADIHLVDGQLLVAHDLEDTSTDRTLENLYLKPLSEVIARNNGKVHNSGKPFWLMIDIKSDGSRTFAALHQQLEKYASILTDYSSLNKTESGGSSRGPVSVVISGNRDFQAIESATPMLAAIDCRISDIYSNGKPVNPPWSGHPARAWVSDNWKNYFSWDGTGTISPDDRGNLMLMVRQAHSHGLLIRFWNTPDNPTVWQLLHESGVDLVNTDRLQELNRFFVGQ